MPATCMLFAVTACSFPRTGEYLYVHIESPQFDVEQTGQSTIGEQIIGLVFHGDMPISYVVKRDEYVIRARIPLDLLGTEIVYTAEDPEGSPLLLTGRTFDQCWGYFRDSRYNLASIDNPLPVLTYFWMERGPDECRAQEPPINEELEAELRILDAQGNVLGEELVTFYVRQNGTYIWWDGP